MWAVVIEEYGSPEVLQLKEIPNLEPNRGLVELLRQIGARHGRSPSPPAQHLPSAVAFRDHKQEDKAIACVDGKTHCRVVGLGE